MSNILLKLQEEFDENPFVSFDSTGQGISRVYDGAWDYTARNEHLRTVSFTAVPESHRANIQRYVGKLLEYNMAKSTDNHVSVSQMVRWKDVLTRISKFWGKSDFSLLSNNTEYRKFKSSIKGRYVQSTMDHIATTINTLNAAGLLDRYVKCSELRVLANDKGSKQYIAMPSTIHAKVLQRVIDTVETYHPHRLEISAVMSKGIKLRDSELANELSKLHVSSLPKKKVKVLNQRVARQAHKLGEAIPEYRFDQTGKWVNGILKDCLMCVALFSGARRTELLSFNHNSYHVIAGVPVLQGKTYKANKGVAKTETWVTHPIALKALELAYDMTQYARDIHKVVLNDAFDNGDITIDAYQRGMRQLSSAFIGTHMGMEYYGKVQSAYLLLLNSGLNLEKFGIVATPEEVDEFNFLNPDWYSEMAVGGSLPKLSLHDLRRSFAVFLVRNRLGNAQTIKYQFKHKNINMSHWYANYAQLARAEDLLMDESLMIEANEAMEELAVEAFDDIYNGSENLSGGGSKDIMKEKEERLGRGETIVMSREEIKVLVKNGSKSIVLLPTGAYCTNSECERLCSIESFAAEDKPCSHLVITDKSAKEMAAQRKRLIKAFTAMNDMGDYAYSRILVGYKEKICHIEHTLKSHKIPFEPFTQQIKVLA
ncbi:hypothetical protein [Photobacterium leiognathi]|uniref:Integrase n=1 Tax=Photobacterium leiognathi TaxID=553611 RepID=A0ABX5GKU3_PHOLE|nr:hypothetical protein [Photobacterium leiognathi]KJF91714.1 hypothetical protein UB42_00050 [Photobacterium leiognathi]PSV86355.1 hypothetical protein CTM94_00670 [Photobacterium leiognathi]